MPHPPILLSHPPSYRRRHRRAKRRRRSEPATFAAASEATVVIRRAAPIDEADITRLAELEDHAPLPAGERLIGELEGRVVAALDMRSGTVVADPFVPTRGIVELLDLRAAQVQR